MHLMTHAIEKQFKCNVCNKTFHMKWRYKKHLQQHESNHSKYCHFFNNDKFCQFEEIGCMYKHEVAPICKTQSQCKVKFCQYKHRYVCDRCDFTTESYLDFEYHQSKAHAILENTASEKPDIFKCNECEFVSKSMVGVKIHASSKHKNNGNKNEITLDEKENSEQSDEEDDDDDYDGPHQCNHCFINRVNPGYVTEDWDDLLRHIWTDHKENTVWGPAH